MLPIIKYNLDVQFAQKKLSCFSTKESTVIGLKWALSKKFRVPASNLRFIVFHQKTSHELSDDSYIWNSGIQEGDTICVEMISTPAKTTQLNTAKLIQETDSNRLIMFKRNMSADHSCLFTCIAYAMENKNYKAARYLREIVAVHISSEPDKYNESILKMSNEDYQEWVLSDLNWGGAIEAEILSRYYGVEICVINTSKPQSTILFGIQFKFAKRIYLLYNGTYYDVVVGNISEDMDPKTDITIFQSKDTHALNEAIALEMQIDKEHFHFDHEEKQINLDGRQLCIEDSRRESKSYEKLIAAKVQRQENFDGRQEGSFEDNTKDSFRQKELVAVKCHKQGSFSKLTRLFKKIIFH